MCVMPPARAAVIIVGGGPCGLMLANELGRRGISATLVDQKPTTTFNPQANATQARTMEHYRRHGFADEVRSLGLPADFPTDIAYFTRFATYELARFSLPSARDAGSIVRTQSGSWSAAELPHRVSQKFVEQVLRNHAESLPGISVNFGWRMTDFRDVGPIVEVDIERSDGTRAQTIRGDFLVAADGARSFVRNRLGFHWTGETGDSRSRRWSRRANEAQGVPCTIVSARAWRRWRPSPDDTGWRVAVVGCSQPRPRRRIPAPPPRT